LGSSFRRIFFGIVTISLLVIVAMYIYITSEYFHLPWDKNNAIPNITVWREKLVILTLNIKKHVAFPNC